MPKSTTIYKYLFYNMNYPQLKKYHTQFFKNNRTVFVVLLTAFVFLYVFNSCKTCKCPAYSENKTEVTVNESG